MTPVYSPKDVVMIGNEVMVVLGYHPTISDLLIVEDHDCKPRYVRESAVISLR